MTPTERIFLARVESRLGPLNRDLRNRLFAAWDLIRQALNERELARAIESGQAEQLIDDLLSDQKTLDPALSSLRARVDQAVMDMARLTAKDMPSVIRPAAFNVLNTSVVDAARTLDTQVIQTIKEDVRETFRQVVTRGIQEGKAPRTIAREARMFLDLAPNQEAAVANFRRMLEQGDREALTRTLRDRRFDGTLRRSLGVNAERGLTTQQVDGMVEAYHRRMVKHNADQHTITAALDAQRVGQRASWEDAIDRGVLVRSDLRRTWLAVAGPAGDGRNRPEHLEMHGKTVGFDELYFPIGLMTPSAPFGICRCIERIWAQAQALRVAA